VLADHAARLTPLTDVDADMLIRSIRSAPLLLGHRGSPGADLRALRDLLLRVSRLADDLPEVTDLDLNPVIASRTGHSSWTHGSRSRRTRRRTRSSESSASHRAKPRPRGQAPPFVLDKYKGAWRATAPSARPVSVGGRVGRDVLGNIDEPPRRTIVARPVAG